ncbi:hypothetical protein GCM10027511_36490 [Hymenobacter humi]
MAWAVPNCRWVRVGPAITCAAQREGAAGCESIESELTSKSGRLKDGVATSTGRITSKLVETALASVPEVPAAVAAPDAAVALVRVSFRKPAGAPGVGRTAAIALADWLVVVGLFESVRLDAGD